MSLAAPSIFGRREARRRAGSLLALVVLTSASSAFVMTAMTAARRSETAWVRFTKATRSPDVMVSTPPQQMDAVIAALSAQPGVRATSAFTWVPVRPKEMADEQQGGFTALRPDFITPQVVAGRLADPSRADEFTINQSMQDLTGLHVGDRTTLLSPLPGIEVDATLVGVIKGPFDVAANRGVPNSYFTAAFGAKIWDELAQVAGEALRPAVIAHTSPPAHPDTIVGELSRQFPDAGFVTAGQFGTDLRHALSTEARSYWALTGAAAFAAAVAIGQILTRSLRQLEGEAVALRALGATTADRTAMLVAPFVAAIVAGVALAFAAAFPLSALVPTGLGGRTDPTAGSWVDVRWLVLVTVGMALALVVQVVLVGRRLGQPHAAADDAGRSPAPALLLRTAPALFGGRAAVGGPDSTARRAARNAVATTALAIAALLAVVVWSSSLHNLRSTPRIYGWDFDVAIDQSFTTPDAQGPITDELAAKLAASPVASRVERVDLSTVSLAGTDVDLWVMTPVKGSIHPTIQRGRAPAGPDEIALSETVLSQLHARVGGTVELSGHAMTVVGAAVYPTIGNGNFGFMGSVSPVGAENLGLVPYNAFVLADLAPGQDVPAVTSLLGDVHVQSPAPPDAIGYLNEARSADTLLAVFVALLGAATIVHALAVGARRRRHDLATARALGMTRRQFIAAFQWHGGVLGVLALAAGVPLGILGGRLVWWLSTHDLDVLDAFKVPVLSTVLVVLATAVGALASGVVIAVSSGATNRASALRNE